MSEQDTIFALSSGAPPAAIGIIRISGSNAFNALKLLAGRLPEPRKASLAVIKSPEHGFTLDHAIMMIFPGPDTATGEDLAELHLHGGRAVIRAVELALSNIDGLRKAQAGEFTRRAFLNGRMDLNEAEGLSDLLTAETEWQRRSAAHMMGGQFGKAIEQWREDVLRVSALVEADLDFSDEDDVANPNQRIIAENCLQIHDSMASILKRPAAEKLRDGLKIVLGGPPNSGKSSLLNAVVSREAAIVSDIAGTTRDIIEVPLSLGGVPLVFTDTAGVRDESGDEIEVIGIERARAAFDNADIILWLGAEGEGPEHSNLFEVATKCDDDVFMPKSDKAITLSAKTGEGLDRLTDRIIQIAKDMLPPQDSYAVNARQREYLSQAASAIFDAGQADDGLIGAEYLRQARLALDALTGRAHTEDMLDALFGRFCIGK